MPTAGWGYGWVGDPDGGTDREQPGGFFFNCLPFMELGDIHELAAGQENKLLKDRLLLQMIQTPIATLTCPSGGARRRFRFVPRGIGLLTRPGRAV